VTTDNTNNSNRNSSNSSNDDNSHDGDTPIPTSPRPLGYWLRVIDRRLDDAMRELFAADDLTLRGWRLLNLVAGTVSDPRLNEKLAARPERVRPLVDRGWIDGEPGAWRLTEAGEAARASLHERVSSLRARVAGAVGPEDFATTLASLEAIARELGWTEGERMPRRQGRGFGRRHPGEGFGHRHDGEHDAEGHGEHFGRRLHGEGFGHRHHHGEHPGEGSDRVRDGGRRDGRGCGEHGRADSTPETDRA
jgi:hypothetical protein